MSLIIGFVVKSNGIKYWKTKWLISLEKNDYGANCYFNVKIVIISSKTCNLELSVTYF